jgi:FkbM family methyltransferase
MFKKPMGRQEELEITFNSHPHVPILVRTGTADPNPFRQVFLEQQYREIPQRASHANQILDLGANVGYSSIWLAMMYPQASIYAVEPLADNFARLQQQVRAAGLVDRIHPLEAAISLRDRREAFYQIGEGFHHTGGSLIADAQHQQVIGQVNCLSLPSILDCFGLSTVDVIKFDVEGIEGKLFTDPPRAVHDIVSACQVVAIEPHGPENSRIVHDFFSSRGWRSSTFSEIVTYYPG